MHSRFVTLDALRGVAAIGVMLFHNCVGIVKHGYLAVDLFFALSGFIIAFSYEAKLRSGLEKSAFALARAVRFWPMIVVGSTLGLAGGLAHHFTHPENANYFTLATQFITSLLLIPDFLALEQDELFPLNTVFWSLFYEVLVNAIYGLWLYTRRSQPLLICLIVIAAIYLLFGPQVKAASLFCRAFVGFFAGVLTYRIFQQFAPRTFPYGWLSCLIVVCVIMAFPFSFKPSGALFLLVDVVFCAVIFLAAGSDPGMPRPVARCSQWLGEISYPLYAVHRPLFYFCSVVIVRLTSGMFAYNIAAFVASVFIVVAADLVLRFYDQPIRGTLNRLTKSRMPLSSRPQTT
jgi:peptidoglycan/LPS O-acetylase OafA/YrhL